MDSLRRAYAFLIGHSLYSALASNEHTAIGNQRGVHIRGLHAPSDEYCRTIGVRVRLIVPQVVPYPIPLDNPPVPDEFSAEKFRQIAADAGVETEVDIRYCRDRTVMLKETLKPGAIVVMADNRLASKLRSNRNHVLLCKKPASTALRSISLWFLYDFFMRWYIS